MNNNKPLVRTYIAALIAVILWGFSFVWSNQIIRLQVPIFTFLFVRLFIAGVILFVYSKLIGKLQKLSSKDFLLMALMAFFEPFIYFIGESFGMKATDSAVIAAVIIATVPITCLLVEKVLYNIPFTFKKIAGIIITLPGVALMSINSNNITVKHLYGIALLFLAVIAATGYGATVKKLSQKYNNYTIATYQFIIGSLYFFPLFLGWGTEGLNSTFFSKDVLVPLISLAILCSCIAFVLWVSAIRNLGIARANIFSSLIPAFSAIGAVILGHETITVTAVIGMAIVICGVILAQKD
ncbi:MAG: DMT family transporter [Bacteroidia bacterium]|nr:DMT family transporter [Bacteroidia bacterium]